MFTTIHVLIYYQGLVASVLVQRGMIAAISFHVCDGLAS